MLRLVAIQAKMSVQDYRTAEDFKAKIFSLCEEALVSYSGEAILTFPEVIGLGLLFAKDYQDLSGPKAKTDFIKMLKRDWLKLVSSSFKYRVALKSIYLKNSLAAYKIYRETFAAAAKEFGVLIVAGSMFLPEIDKEPSRGVHIKGRQVYNYSYSFLASSKSINRVGKVNLTRLEQKLLLSNASLSENYPFEVNKQKIAVAICLDAFYDSVIRRYDALGATIIVQPSANFAVWDRPWPQDKSLSEGEAWLKYGLREQIQGRENIVYGINPMLVGELFGMLVQGRSNIVANKNYLPNANIEGYDGLLAISKNFNKEEFVIYDVS